MGRLAVSFIPRVEERNIIGLLGGSFDPPHEGHLHVSKRAIQVFGLQKVWWLLSTGNPFKIKGPASLKLRMEACEKILCGSRILATDLEVQFKTCYTSDTLKKMLLRYPRARFVWLMGADNFVNFHRWKDSDWIMKNIPIGIMSRPGENIRAGLSQASFRYRNCRLKTSRASQLAFLSPPVWTIVDGSTNNASSTKIRSTGNWYLS